MAITPGKFLRNLSNFQRKIKQNQGRIEISVLKRMQGDIKRRVFNEGNASDGAPISAKRKAKAPRIGDYSTQHGKKRIAKGRQIANVDLEFFGRLRRSIVVGKSGKENVIGFVNDKQRVIAEAHEDYRKKPIFKPSEKELERAKKTAVKEAETIIKQCFKNS